jgi:adenylyl- and sulfurtransferase ThiI
VYLTKPYAYICIYYDKGLGGIPNNSQNKKAICCIFDELSAVSCAETIKQGFDTKLIICFTKESELLDLAKMVNQLIHKTVKSKLDLEFYKVPIKKTLTSLLLLEITTELLSRVANSNNIKRISLSLSPLIYPIDFLENTLTQIYKKKLIPYLPLSGLDDNITSSAKEIGLERYVSNIHKHSKSKFYNSNKSEKEIKKITDVTISTRKTIFINVGPNSLHEILDKIIPEH